MAFKSFFTNQSSSESMKGAFKLTAIIIVVVVACIIGVLAG